MVLITPLRLFKIVVYNIAQYTQSVDALLWSVFYYNRWECVPFPSGTFLSLPIHFFTDYERLINLFLILSGVHCHEKPLPIPRYNFLITTLDTLLYTFAPILALYVHLVLCDDIAYVTMVFHNNLHDGGCVNDGTDEQPRIKRLALVTQLLLPLMMLIAFP